MDDIWLHIAADNMPAADGVLDTIGDAAKRLAAQPLMGRARPELSADIRSFPVGRYLLFYRPVPGGIQLVRTLHGARDLPGLAAEGGFPVD